MADLTPQQIQKLRDELEQLNKAKQQGLDYDKERQQLLTAYLQTQNKSAQVLAQTLIDLEAYRQKLENIGNTIDGNLLKREVGVEMLREQIRLNQELIRSGADNADELLKANAKYQDMLDKQETILDVQKEMNKDMRQTTSLVQAAEKAAAKMALSFQNPTMALGQLNVGFQKLGGFLTGKFIDGFTGMITAFDETSKAFETQFAVGNEYKGMLGDIYGEQATLGVSMEELTKGMGDLITNFTDFTMLLPAQQKQLASTATMMQEAYGVSTADFSKGIQHSTKMLGMGVNAAKDFATEIVSTAEALGVAPAQLSAQFAQMGPQLAKFGTQGGKAFKELARISKITGMEMGKILAITNKFDTFEGAAEQAGQLNAALGGNFVNAMDLMMATDPAERFNMIRDAILDTGLTFDTMSYYQKQFYTNALGLSDVGDLALMLSGNMDALGGATNQTSKDYQEQAERAKALMTIQEKLQSIFLQSAPQIEYFATKLSDLATYLQENGKQILIFAGVLQSLNLVWAGWRAIQMFRAANAVISLANGTKEVVQTEAKTVALAKENMVLRENIGLKMKANAMGAAPPPVAAGMSAAAIAAIGVALVGLGVGLMAAGKGVAFMAEAMQDMSPAQILAMSAPIAALALSFYALVPAITAVAAAGAGAAGPLMALSLPLLAIGLAVGIASAGIGFMAQGFALMFESINLEKMGGFAIFVGSLVAGAIFMKMAGVGMGALAIGLGLVGLALKFIATDDLEAIATFTESLANTSVAQMRELAGTIKAVANAMDDIPVRKATVFDAVLKQTVMAATVLGGGARIAQVQRGGTTTANNTNNNAPRGKLGDILIKFDSELFKDKVISIYEEADGISAREAAYNS